MTDRPDNEFEAPRSKATERRACRQCGAELTFAPGTTELTCGYCGFTDTIDVGDASVEELDLHDHMERIGAAVHGRTTRFIDCPGCGATQHIEEKDKSMACIYCARPLIVEDSYDEEWIVPGAVVPFKLEAREAHGRFRRWIDGLWFAPNALKRATLSPENTRGLYLPFWTFDANVSAAYRGERGEYYYVTKTVGSGENRRTVRERRTRWYPASGTVRGFIDDTLISASRAQGLAVPQVVRNWNLQELVPFDERFLAGFVTEKYGVSLEEGHVAAIDAARDTARQWARRDIGGDTQRVHHVDVQMADETFKHVLLPVYMSTYRYKNTVYHFYVNGQTGAIHGDRPWSAWKIALAVIAALLVLGAGGWAYITYAA